MRLSLAGKTLAALPFVCVAAWTGNAMRLRLVHQHQGEFIVGSMDDQILDSLETGDLVLFTRNLTTLPPAAALYTWLVRERVQPRFDHVGWIFVDHLGRKFVVEETLDKVQCRPYSARILSSQAHEIAVLPLRTTVLGHLVSLLGWTT